MKPSSPSMGARSPGLAAIVAVVASLAASMVSLSPAASQGRQPLDTAVAGDFGVVLPYVVAQIEAVLASRSAAVMAGDADAHLATIAPSAPEGFVTIDGRAVDASATLGFASYTEQLATAVGVASPRSESTGVINLAPANSANTLVLEVVREFEIAGIDQWPAASTLYLSFIDTDDGWKVAGDDALASIGLASERALWELADVDVARTPRTVVYGTAGMARLKEVAALTEAAIDRFEANWNEPWQGAVAVAVPTNLAEVEALLRPTSDASRFVAFTTLRVNRSNGWDMVSPRIVSQESNFSRRSIERQTEIMVHELVHVASVRASGPATPLWLHEGLAEWVTNGRQATPDGTVSYPDLFLFRTGSAAQIAQIYDQAEQTLAQIAGQFGDDAPWQLFVDVGATHGLPGTSDYLVTQALQAIGQAQQAIGSGDQ